MGYKQKLEAFLRRTASVCIELDHNILRRVLSSDLIVEDNHLVAKEPPAGKSL
jgi:hypothetical protein